MTTLYKAIVEGNATYAEFEIFVLALDIKQALDLAQDRLALHNKTQGEHISPLSTNISSIHILCSTCDSPGRLIPGSLLIK